MQLLFAIMVSIAILLICAETTLAEGNNTVLRITCNDYPPWKILADNGTCSGINVELSDELARRMGLKAVYVPCPFKRCLRMMEFGEADLMTGLLRRPDREEYMDFLETPYKNSSDKAFYMRTGQENELTEYSDLHHLRIGVGAGGKYDPKFDTDTNIEKDAAPGSEYGFLKLIKKRVDAVIVTETVGDYYLRVMGLTDEVRKAPFGFRSAQNVYMALSKRSTFAPRLEEFNRRLNEMVNENALENAKKKFMNGVVPDPALR